MKYIVDVSIYSGEGESHREFSVNAAWKNGALWATEDVGTIGLFKGFVHGSVVVHVAHLLDAYAGFDTEEKEGITVVKLHEPICTFEGLVFNKNNFDGYVAMLRSMQERKA